MLHLQPRLTSDGAVWYVGEVFKQVKAAKQPGERRRRANGIPGARVFVLISFNAAHFNDFIVGC